MFRVRIKTSPEGNDNKSTGQQEGYGLVRNLNAIQSSPQSVSVNNKMGAVPRSEANIEVEGGESVIGDVNKDGTMELMHFVGKRHNEGGVPVNIPEGSFIYSDTKNLTIKDPEVLQKIFNLPARKQGYTPAEISRKYDVNSYVEILKDDTSDPLAKRSAAEMLKKNKQKLGILAFIQESMKGFPDGIPAIAEEVLATMGIDPNQLAQQFAPQQQPQGMGMEQGMMPPMESQGIPMSEDEDAMQGMLPEGPAVAPDDLANQMPAKFGGIMIPSYKNAGTVKSCAPGYAWNPNVGACVKEAFKFMSRGLIPVSAYPPLNTSNLNGKSKPKSNYDNSGYMEHLKNAIISGNKNAKNTPPKKVQPLGDNSFAAQFSVEDQAKIEAKRKHQRQLAEQYAKEQAAKNKKIAEDKAKNPYKYQIPGFGSKSDLKAYMNSGSGEFAVGDIFYKALLSMDPAQMIGAAEEIKNVDIDWSLGWLPFTNQDKVDDMYSILHEEAYKILNQKEKEKLKTHYKPEDILGKAENLANLYETKAKDATSVADKERFANEALKYRRYKDYIQSDDHKAWRKEVDNSKVWTENTWWPVPGIGKPIQDKEVKSRDIYGPQSILFNDTEMFGINLGLDDLAEETDVWYEGPRHKTYLEIYDEITKGHDRYKNTSIATIAPLGNKGLTHTNERQGFLNWDRPEIIENVRTINKVQNPGNSPRDAKNYAQEYKLNAAPGSTFRMGKNVDGQLMWFEHQPDGSEYEVSNSEYVKILNEAATKREGKKVALQPSSEPMDIIKILEQENKINPPQNEVTPTPKNKRTDVVAPIVPQQNTKPKYENGVTEGTFENAFGSGGMKFGGVMPSLNSNITIGDKVFRYGGLINENGKLRYDRGGSVLPKYGPGGSTSGGTEPIKSEVKVVTDPKSNGGKPMNAYTLTFKDPNGNPDTVVQVLEDQATGSVIARKNTVTGQSVPNGVQITRGSYEYITKDNLNEYEKKVLAEKWNNDEAQYLTFLNTSQEMRRNTEFKNDLYSQYKIDIGKDNNYTKRGSGKSKYNAKLAAMNTPELMIDELLAFEERNARLSAYGLADGEQNVVGGSGQGAYLNKTAQDLITANPAALGDLDFSQGYKGQAGYIAYNNLLTQNPKYTSQNFASPQYGVSDEDIGYGKSTVSGIDNWNTNTTLKQRLGWNSTPPPIIPPETKPGEKNTFYCVEYSDGTKETKTVSYKEGEQPVAPSGEVDGKTVTNATQYTTADDATKSCGTPPIIPPGTKQSVQPQTWFAPDIVNYAAGVRQIIPNTPPVLRQMSPAYSGYDTINPITQIAGVTGLMRQQQDLAMNTMDPTAGFAAMAGQGYDELGQRIGQVEIDNATKIVNPYLQTIGQLNTDVDYKNAILRGKFDTEGAVYQEELAAQRNKKDAQNAMLYGQGWGNVLKDNTLRVAYPNAQHADRIMPTLSWSGVGRDPLAPDTYVSPISSSTSQADCASAYQTAYNQVKNDATMDEDAKKEYASNMQKACISQNITRANTQNKTQQQLYAQNVNAMMGNSKFGGTMYTAPGYMEYGGVYFDDIY